MNVASLEEIRKVIRYCPKTGYFERLVDSKRGKSKAGDIAGTKTSHSGGYVEFWVLGKKYLAHRLAWYLMTGVWPEGQVDHINGERSDNRWCNLRTVSNGENQQNLRRAKRHNKVGLLGVSKNKNRWKAEIRYSGIRKHIGTYDTPHEAHKAYLDFKAIVHIGGGQR